MLDQSNIPSKNRLSLIRKDSNTGLEAVHEQMAKVFKDCPQDILNQSNIEFDSDAIVHGDS